MKDICVFVENEEEYQYTLLRSFDKDEELDLWLENTTENKEYLMIMRQYKKREKGYRCVECGEISSTEDIDNTTKNYFGGDIVSITDEDMDVSDYICPKCKEIVSGSCFRKVY